LLLQPLPVARRPARKRELLGCLRRIERFVWNQVLVEASPRAVRLRDGLLHGTTTK